MMMQQILAFDHEHAHLADPELDPSEWQFRQQFHQRVFALAHLANQQPVFAQMRWRVAQYLQRQIQAIIARTQPQFRLVCRSEEHTSELQSLMRISYAVFCLKNKKHNEKHSISNNQQTT